MRRAAVDFPFVPTTCTDSNERSGFPSRASSSRIRSVPKPSAGHGLSNSSQLTADGIELAPVALELLALGVDDRGRRVRDEALVRELFLRTLDLLAQPFALGVGIAVRLRALRLDDRVEDTALVALERRNDAGAAEPLRVLLPPSERARLRLVARLRPRRDDQPRLADRQERPDLFG